MKLPSSPLTDAAFFAAGGLIYSLSVNCFAAPNAIAPGGVTGLSILINALTRLPIGTLTLALNLPLLLWGICAAGWRTVSKTVAAVLFVSVLIDLTGLWLPAYHGNRLLAAIFGGVFSGTGLSLVFLRGGTTGGTDLAAMLLGRRFHTLSMGKLMQCIDIPIVLLSFPVYHNIESPMYALIEIAVSTKVIDSILYGASLGTGKIMFILSAESAAIRSKILLELSRGVTELHAHGSYSGRGIDLLLVAVRRPEVYRVYALVHRLDPHAFIMVTDASDITGEGFRKMPS